MQVKYATNFFYLMLHGFQREDYACLCEHIRCYDKFKKEVCNVKENKLVGNKYYIKLFSNKILGSQLLREPKLT